MSYNLDVSGRDPALPAVRQGDVHPFAYGIENADLGTLVKQEEIL